MAQGQGNAKGVPVLHHYRSSFHLERGNQQIDMRHMENTDKVRSSGQSNQGSPVEHRAANRDLVVCIENLCKSYEEGKPILNGLCMHVKQGTIYGLLGSSGSGKTTLLSCVVGLTNWDSGHIRLFNKRPKGAPGRRVGFMPQDIALYQQVSIREMIGYYGRLYGMSNQDVEKQWIWLVDFLHLPSKFKLIKELSGGQQRRVSLAISLVHSPELLILDEPTVGLDPLLRESIWNYLVKMVQTQKTTVIITTHYIEETRLSNTIGVMRKGRLLVEDSPDTLMQTYGCDLLEQVVLKLCRKDDHASGKSSDSSSSNNNISSVVVHSDKIGRGSGGKSSSKNSYNVYEKFQENLRLTSQRRSSIRMDNPYRNPGAGSRFRDRVQGMSTVLWLLFVRHPVFMAMILFLPTLQMLLTLAVMGTHPRDLHFGVVNHEMQDYDFCFNNLDSTGNLTNEMVEGRPSSCNFQMLSCSLITDLARSGTITLVPVETEEYAHDMVMQGDLWGYFSFPDNYSKHLADFIAESKFSENDTLSGSRVSLRMDMSHYLGAAMAIQKSFEAYEEFVRKLAISCSIDPKEFQLPLLYREPVYGKNDANFRDYVIPIVILTVIFEIPMLVTSIIFINDRKQGTLDRARVAGLQLKEIMFSHFITQGSVVIGQTVICFIVMVLVFNFHVKGSYVLYFFICIWCGLAGESLGLMLGIVFKDEVEAVMFGIFLGPILLTWEGALWPIEGIRASLRNFAYASPTTLMIESLRSIVDKGVGFTHPDVWPGIIIIVGWTIFFWILSVVLFIRKQK